MKFFHLLFWLVGFASVLLAAEPSGATSFDRWAEGFSKEWTQTPSRGDGLKKEPVEAPADADEVDGIFLEAARLREDRKFALAQRGLAELSQWPAAKLNATQRVSAELLRWHLETFVAGRPFTEHAFVFRQLRGLHVSMVDSLAERSTLRRPKDVNDYLERLGKVATRIDEGIVRSRTATARGLLPPRFILERSLQQLEMFLAPVAEQNIFVVSLARRSEAIKGLDPKVRADALAQAARVVAEQVRPAYARVGAYLRELLPRSTDAAGISRLPEGPAAYAQALQAFTSTRLTAEQIHAIGLREVARLEHEMDDLLRGLGLREGNLEQRLAQAAAPIPLPAVPEPRGILLARYTEIIRDAEKRSAALFNLKPLAPVEVRRVPLLTEKTASAHYTSPPADGSRGGIFWVPLPGPSLALTPRMRSLAYHEAVPGHHFQLAIQQELKELPRFRARRLFGGISAHSEGWALYVERLAVEQGWYEGDVPGRLGALSSELFRAKRLVVDTGLHTQGWTRQQAIDYGISASEVERYVVNPGQACSYMVGLLGILDARGKAQAALGRTFSLPAFHDVVLRTGTVPLDLLAKVVDEWISTQRPR